MLIGKLARAVNCHIETVRYYEKVGLLSPSRRKYNGYRDYTQDHLQHLRLIRRARSLGFSQDEVRNLVELTNVNDNSCDKVHDMALQQLNVINEKLKEMQDMKKALRKLADACESGDHENCPVLDELIAE